MPKISIIVPVYNTEKYIEKCLNSIKSQTIKDYEIIVVNDGSKDNSEVVINNWIKANKDIDLKYYKKINEGLSSARNYGIENANGEYLMFLDSDDYIENNLFKQLMPYIEDRIDLIKFKMKTVTEDDILVEKNDGPVFEKCSGEEALKNFFGKEKFMDVACIYLYRRDFFIENRFKYNTINKYHEDFGLTPLIIVNAKTVVSTNVYGYCYKQTNNSITRNEDYLKTKQKAKDVLAHYDNMLEKLKGYVLTSETEELIKAYYTNTVILKINELNKTDKKEFISEIKKRKMYKNIKAKNLKQFIKRYLLKFNINLYLKVR